MRAPQRPVISFRTAQDLHLRLEQLRATFPSQTWSEVFTWLLDQEEVRAAIRERLSS